MFCIIEFRVEHMQIFRKKNTFLGWKFEAKIRSRRKKMKYLYKLHFSVLCILIFGQYHRPGKHMSSSDMSKEILHEV